MGATPPRPRRIGRQGAPAGHAPSGSPSRTSLRCARLCVRPARSPRGEGGDEGPPRASARLLWGRSPHAPARIARRIGRQDAPAGHAPSGSLSRTSALRAARPTHPPSDFFLCGGYAPTPPPDREARHPRRSRSLRLPLPDEPALRAALAHPPTRGLFLCGGAAPTPPPGSAAPPPAPRTPAPSRPRGERVGARGARGARRSASRATMPAWTTTSPPMTCATASNAANASSTACATRRSTSSGDTTRRASASARASGRNRTDGARRHR